MHTTHTIPLSHHRALTLGPTPTLMGILNVTPDSFSDGGEHALLDAAIAHAHAMIAEGADIIDIGGESTRPGAAPVSIQDELDRVIPVIEALVAAGITAPISIDTYKPLVADQAIQSGAALINDVHGLQGAPEMADIAALHNVPVIAMHWDKARDLTKPITDEVRRYFDATIALAERAGISRTNLILDPGFGFSKSLAENYQLLQEIQHACSGTTQNDHFPILVGTSRKSMIGKLLGNEPHERLAGTIATNVLAYSKGGHIFRVHDIRPNRDALRVAQATLYGPPENPR
ncbi:dihydropteroate synthase [Devosia sp.]|uniref:dihydropteroate synthase n=1 Tax=Devosia sp. TaxID=1871048 RepID=UPI00260CE964|nr:dihydropteroate synthase [Devosia sp.]